MFIMSRLESTQGSLIKPLQRQEYLFFFGMPTLLMIVSVYWLLPYFVSLGISEYLGLQLASLVPYLTMSIGAVIACQMDGYPLSWKAFRNRFRLRRLNGHDWIWVLVLVTFSFISYLTLRQVVASLLTDKLNLLPISVPRIIDPRLKISVNELAGGTVRGNWLLVVVSSIVLFFNIFGEELWWRGYLLPRQEVSHGGNAWIEHGILWTLFHVFKYWELIAILPVGMAFSFVAQYRKNTWPGIIAHFSVNSLGVIGLLLLAAG